MQLRDLIRGARPKKRNQEVATATSTTVATVSSGDLLSSNPGVAGVATVAVAGTRFNGSSQLPLRDIPIVDQLTEWVDTAQPGDGFELPEEEEWEQLAPQIKRFADDRIRRRHPALRIWREGVLGLRCKLWVH